MEIPYIVTPRKDTGLNNSKIAIWLFLASEVMLFGGLFSAYIFLRIYADYPWPERALAVLPGLINTFILIASSVTVVFAWAALKLRNWRAFQGFMGFTVFCALVFMVLKSIEYNAKFHHHAVRTSEYSAVEGHLHYFEKGHGHESAHAGGESSDKDGGHDSHADHTYLTITGKESEGGEHIEENFYVVDPSKGPASVTFDLDRFQPDYDKYISVIIGCAGEGKITLAKDYWHTVRESNGDTVKVKEEKLFEAGSVLALTDDNNKANVISIAELQQAKSAFIAAREHDQGLRTAAQRAAGAALTKALKEDTLLQGLSRWEDDAVQFRDNAYKSEIAKLKDAGQFDSELGRAASTITFAIADDAHLVRVLPNWGFMTGKKAGGDTNIALLDGTLITGIAGVSSLPIAVDTLDFTHLVMRAEEKGLDAKLLIEESLLFSNDIDETGQLRKVWEAHKIWLGMLTDKLAKEDKVPTHIDMYRVTWHQMVAYQRLNYQITNLDEVAKATPGLFDDFAGANHKDPEEVLAYPLLHIPREEIVLDSKLTPKWNNYYALYFTITGLHGLHVVGGAIVLGYYLFFGRKMYEENPDWLANRVEVGGLFWHFVDLVWIFVFPIFYLM